MTNTFTPPKESGLDKYITLPGSWPHSTVTIPYDVALEARRRKNLIANGYRPADVLTCNCPGE